MLDINADVAWLQEDGPESDVVLSCRARLARNLGGFPFGNRATEGQQMEIVQHARRAVQSAKVADELYWIELDQSTPHDRRLLLERQLISVNLLEREGHRAVAVSSDETLSIMVNEEDHLRVQVLRSGHRLPDALNQLSRTDVSLERQLDFAFSERLGYLTACPTNIGTGLRLGVMVHLPGLKITKELDRLRRASKELNLAVRGFYGEGSESIGEFYQISNQVTLGCSQQEILDMFNEDILPRVIEYERTARQMLLDRQKALVEDRVQRSVGILGAARLVGTEEAMKLLSRVRLGISLGLLPDMDRAMVDRLFLRVQPAHLQAVHGQRLGKEEQRGLRAELLRTAFSG